MPKAGIPWGKPLKVHPAQHKLVHELFAIMLRQHMTMKDMSARAGLDYVSVGKWKYLHTPTIANFDAALNVLGYRLAIIPVRIEPSCRPAHFMIDL